jgi:hypothetical protein
MEQIRMDIPRTTNGVLVRYKRSRGYRKTCEYYQDKIVEGWEFCSNYFPHPKAKKLELPALKERIDGLMKKGLEIFVGEIAFSSDGRIVNNGKVIFTRKNTEENTGEKVFKMHLSLN